MAVVAAVNKRSAKDPILSHLLHIVAFLSAIVDIITTAQHLPGVQNTSADALSHNNLKLFLSLSISNPSHHPSRTPGAGVQQVSTMDLANLDGAVELFLNSCVAASTHSAYKSAQRWYIAFCTQFGVASPYPLQEHTLCRYVAYLAQQGLKHRTIKAYLLGIRCY